MPNLRFSNVKVLDTPVMTLQSEMIGTKNPFDDDKDEIKLNRVGVLANGNCYPNAFAFGLIGAFKEGQWTGEFHLDRVDFNYAKKTWRVLCENLTKGDGIYGRSPELANLVLQYAEDFEQGNLKVLLEHVSTRQEWVGLSLMLAPVLRQVAFDLNERNRQQLFTQQPSFREDSVFVPFDFLVGLANLLRVSLVGYGPTADQPKDNKNPQSEAVCIGSSENEDNKDDSAGSVIRVYMAGNHFDWLITDEQLKNPFYQAAIKLGESLGFVERKHSDRLVQYATEKLNRYLDNNEDYSEQNFTAFFNNASDALRRRNCTQEEIDAAFTLRINERPNL